MCLQVKDFLNYLNFLSKLDSILIIILILVNLVTLTMFIEKPIILFCINLALLAGYFLLTDRDNKIVLLVAALNFAFWGVVLEAFIIRKTNFALRYKMDMGVLEVPAWLFTIYMVFIIAAVFTYDSFKVLMNKYE
jgi:hypothetical protein